MRIRLLGGFAVEHDGRPVEVVGAMQRGLLFRLALDAGSRVGYRALAEDLWPDEAPDNARAALQNLVSRLRAQLPTGALETGQGGYRLTVARDDVDAVRFQDLVAAAASAPGSEAPALASAALELWRGEPWTPGAGYDWFERDLATDRATAVRLATPSPAEPESEPAPAIPVALTGFVGRDEELAVVAGQLERGRLVTILGPGGAGKTRLALESARARRHPIVVELAPAGPDELWQAVLGAIGRDLRSVGESAAMAATPFDRVAAALAGRDALLVLDNCEHLISAAAAAAHDLLQALPRLHILATSREPLGVPGEAFVPLGPLDPVAAATLFADRVLAARGRALGDEEQEEAARIRERLDGLPLALELAAAKARTMSLPEIADGLDDRFELLSGGLRTVLPRHQTLRALVDWSWSLLDEGERSMLAALAIYPAGIAASDAAEAAAAHGGTRAQLDALVDKSLLQRANGRYRALETIREYGIERLAERGDLVAQRRAQACRLAAATAVYDARLRSSDIHAAIAWFDAEDDNLAAALRFCADAPHPETLVDITGGCLWYWIVRDRNEDALTWSAAAAPHADGDRWQAVLLRAAGYMMRAFGGSERGRMPDLDTRELGELSAAAGRTEHDIVLTIPVIVEAVADAGPSENWMNLARFPDPDSRRLTPWGRGIVLVARAALAQNRGELADLGDSSRRAVELFRGIGDGWGLSIAQQMRAEWLMLEGRFEEALAMADSSTDAMSRITSSWDLLQQQGLAVTLLMRLGRPTEARERIERILARARESDSARAVTLADTMACSLAVEFEDAAWGRALIDEMDERLAEWDDVPPQLRALAGTARGGVAALDGDTETAERELRAAAEAAVASNDYPIMASVAVGLASLAARLERWDDAARALDLGTALRGAPDPHGPTEARVRAALRRATAGHPAGAGEPGERTAVDRDAAAAALTQILRR